MNNKQQTALKFWEEENKARGFSDMGLAEILPEAILEHPFRPSMLELEPQKVDKVPELAGKENCASRIIRDSRDAKNITYKWLTQNGFTPDLAKTEIENYTTLKSKVPKGVMQALVQGMQKVQKVQNSEEKVNQLHLWVGVAGLALTLLSLLKK